MREKTNKINKMENMPVNKLMIVMGIPMIISMVLQAVYNICRSKYCISGNFSGT